MNKIKLSNVMFACCNAFVVLLSIISAVYSISSTVTAEQNAISIFNNLNKDYEACFNKKYVHEDSYLTDITIMKMEIVEKTISKSAELKKQFFNTIHNLDSEEKSQGRVESIKSKAFDLLQASLADIQDFNRAIEYTESSLPLLSNINSLYSALNYMTFGSNALLVDFVSFSDDESSLSLASEKDIQQIHVMANMSSTYAINADRLLSIHKYIIPLISLIVLFGTGTNIYRLQVYKNRYKIKSKNINNNLNN